MVDQYVSGELPVFSPNKSAPTLGMLIYYPNRYHVNIGDPYLHPATYSRNILISGIWLYPLKLFPKTIATFSSNTQDSSLNVSILARWKVDVPAFSPFLGRPFFLAKQIQLLPPKNEWENIWGVIAWYRFDIGDLALPTKTFPENNRYLFQQYKRFLPKCFFTG